MLGCFLNFFGGVVGMGIRHPYRVMSYLVASSSILTSYPSNLAIGRTTTSNAMISPSR